MQADASALRRSPRKMHRGLGRGSRGVGEAQAAEPTRALMRRPSAQPCEQPAVCNEGVNEGVRGRKRGREGGGEGCKKRKKEDM